MKVDNATASPLMETYRRRPVRFVEGRGAMLRDDRGRTYVDMVAGLAVASVGHAHPEVAGAVADQAARLFHSSNLYENPLQVELAERLRRLSGGKQAFFTNSGAEAVECALKLARRWGRERDPQKIAIVCAHGGFHGRTFGALSATGQPAKKDPFEPLVPGFVHVPYGDAAAVRSRLAEDVAAVLLEPVQGEAGVIVPPSDYLASVRAACDAVGALLIVDEVQTGYGRTGRWFGHQHSHIEPDVICLAKAMAGGLPMGACLAAPEVAGSFRPGDHATTFGGGPIQTRAALAVLDVIEREGLVDRADELGAFLRDELRRTLGAAVEVRGLGLLVGVEFPSAVAQEVVDAAMARGVIFNDATPTVVRLCPPLVVTKEQISQAVHVLGEVWDAIATA